jgi:hypothetical protein
MTKLGKSQATAIVAQLIEIKRTFNRQIDELIDGISAGNNGRVVRDYDLPPADADELAAKWGVDLSPDPEDTIPESVQTRLDRILHKEPTSDHDPA